MRDTTLELFPDPPGPDANASPVSTGRSTCRIIVDDTRKALAGMDTGVFQACISSPPFWGLRDYNIDGQIGAEPLLENYIQDLTAVFREVRRTLADDGVLFLNLGDTYTSGGRAYRAPDAKNPARAMSFRAPTPAGLKPKDLIGVPWRVAFALQADGWYLRSEIIWYKPNCQPESVKDRPTRSHEHVFLFSKSEQYYYDQEAVKEPSADQKGWRQQRDVWCINTEPYAGAHFAVFPPALVRPCVLAGTHIGDHVLDPFFGSGTTGLVCLELGRDCTGIELNPEYARLARGRLGEYLARHPHLPDEAAGAALPRAG